MSTSFPALDPFTLFLLVLGPFSCWNVALMLYIKFGNGARLYIHFLGVVRLFFSGARIGWHPSWSIRKGRSEGSLLFLPFMNPSIRHLGESIVRWMD